MNRLEEVGIEGGIGGRGLIRRNEDVLGDGIQGDEKIAQHRWS